MSINKCNFHVRNISHHMLQGFECRPHTIFILYVNDICNISKLIKCILFTGDTKLLCADSDIKRLSDTMCGMPDKVSTWFAVNRLTLSISKTNYKLFGNRMLSTDVVIYKWNVNTERGRVVQF